MATLALWDWEIFGLLEQKSGRKARSQEVVITTGRDRALPWAWHVRALMSSLAPGSTGIFEFASSWRRKMKQNTQKAWTGVPGRSVLGWGRQGWRAWPKVYVPSPSLPLRLVAACGGHGKRGLCCPTRFRNRMRPLPSALHPVPPAAPAAAHACVSCSWPQHGGLGARCERSLMVGLGAPSGAALLGLLAWVPLRT